MEFGVWNFARRLFSAAFFLAPSDMSDEKHNPESPTKASNEAKEKAVTEGKVGAAERPHVVVFDKVTKQFGEGPNARVAIEDVTFTVEDLPDIGELIAIVGPSGCGKSTLLRTIAALKPHYPPTKGDVRVFGKPIHE